MQESASWGGECLLPGGCLLLGGVSASRGSARGVPAPRGCLLRGVSAWGVSAPRGCLLWGVSVSRGSAPGGMSAWGWGVCSGGNVCSWGDVCSRGGCLLQGRGVCIPACTKADTPLLTESQMPVKTLPWPNFVAAGTNGHHTVIIDK